MAFKKTLLGGHWPAYQCCHLAVFIAKELKLACSMAFGSKKSGFSSLALFWYFLKAFGSKLLLGILAYFWHYWDPFGSDIWNLALTFKTLQCFNKFWHSKALFPGTFSTFKTRLFSFSNSTFSPKTQQRYEIQVTVVFIQILMRTVIKAFWCYSREFSSYCMH